MFPRMGPAYYDQSGKAEDSEEELRRIFSAFDLQKTGSINKQELAEILRRLGVTLSEDELAATLGAADFKKNGVIEWEEFKTLMMTQIYKS